MANDPERDLVPMKDVKGTFGSPKHFQTEGNDIRDRPTVSDKRVAIQLARDELEDRFFHLKDENLMLKKTSRKQEDQIKKLATKMSRLLSEKKKLEQSSSPGKKRDIEMEEIVEDLQDRIRDLEKHNAHLREKLLVAKQQVVIHTRKPNAYPHIPPKVNTGRPKSGNSTKVVTSNFKNRNIYPQQRRTPSAPLSPYAINLLEEARNELSNLKELVSTQRTQLDVYEQEIEVMKEQLRIREAEFEEEVMMLKSQITQGQRQHVQENMDLIRLHRELKQKSTKFITLQAQYVDLEEKMKAMKSSHDHLVKEVEELTNQIKEEQKKSLELFGELQKNKATLINYSELQESIKSLKKEKEILKDTNDKLIKSVLDPEKSKAHESLEQSLKNHITQLESSLKNELHEKTTLTDELIKEKEKYAKINEDHTHLEEKFAGLKDKLVEMEAKLNILKSEEVDFDEIGEALALIKLKKQRSLKLDFLERVPSEEEEDLKLKLKKAESDHVETIKELNDVREMLMTQYKINKDAHAEIQSITEKAAQQEKEYQTKLEEYAHLLDIRAARIQKFERQLNDIAYGTKKFKVPGPEGDIDLDKNESVELDRGENIFEVHIDKALYSSDGLRAFGDNNPSTFLTWTFYEFELQSTPVIKGTKPYFNCTSQYTIRVDDYFLYYIHKGTTTLELHEVLGTDYRTVAACQLNFSEVVEQPHGRLHGNEQLIGIGDRAGIIFGTVDYWVRLHIPMEQAFKLYKEKFKALSYLHSNQETAATAVKLLNQPSPLVDGINDLHIKILRCINLKGNRKDMQPSPFCIYKFYDLPDQDTAIIPASNNPEFSDHRTFPLHMDSDLDKYLKTQILEIYVFDDNDPEEAAYIGKASIPLLPLSQNKSLKGLFELIKDDKTGYGSIEVSLYWQHEYLLFSNITSIPKSLNEPIAYPSHVKPVQPAVTDHDELPSKEETRDNSAHTLGSNTPVPQPRARNMPKQPVASSTPVKPAKIFVPENNIPQNKEKNQKKQNSPAMSPVHPEIKPRVPPRPSPRSSKLPPKTVDEFIAYGKSFLNSPKKLEKSFVSPQCSSKDSSKPIAERPLQTTHENEFEDTMLEKKQEISFEEISEEEDKQALLTRNNTDDLTESETESEVYISKTLNVSDSENLHNIVIGVSHLCLQENASMLKDPSVQMLYVEYRFLDYPLEELETPFSLPKPSPPQKIVFNFRKVFHIDPEVNHEKFQLLTQMLSVDSSETSKIIFTVVSEPPEDKQDLDCEDVGYAYVDLQEIVSEQRDVIEEDIIIYDAKNSETELGRLNVTVEILKALQFLQILNH